MKIVSRKILTGLIKSFKEQKKSIVFTNGCFDILHVGHVRYLQAAKQLGDILIVGLNSDVSVQILKGPARPVNGENDRAEVLAGLAAVDYITVFDEITAEKLIEAILPDIYVKGGDYIVDNLPEAKIVRQYGGKIVLIQEVKGHSSTKLIEKLQDL